MLFQIPGGVELLFIGVVVLLFLAVTFAVIGGFLLVRRSRSPDQQRLDRLEDQVQELQRRVDRLDDQ
jgi:outer membrane murein-binding lipoprotein Lpp